MKVVILAGGGGTRLFPLSRSSYPKQFLKFGGKQSLLSKTVSRFLKLVKPEDLVVVTNQEYLYHVQSELIECKAQAAHIVLEPVARNTAPAIALAAKYCNEILGASMNEVLVVAAADHVIRDEAKFIECMTEGIALAEKDRFVTFGIHPETPKTEYGYVEAEKIFESGYLVSSFKEKPDIETAQKYIESGNFYWNSGIFTFTIDFIFRKLAKYQPEIMKGMEGDYEQAIKRFSSLPNISIDYAVAEKADNVVVVPLRCYWNDIGSWDAMYDVLEKDSSGNALEGDCLAIDCKNSLLMGRDRLIAGIGLDDILLVETDDVIVIAKKGESQKVKNVVEELKRRGRKEATMHTTLYRSWGSSAVLGEGAKYRLKKIRINPGESLSLQMHYHRSEHWIVLTGTAKVLIEERILMLHENESVFIPQTTKHKLENPGKITLEIIEVQNGNYIGEDDIVRFD